MTLLLTPAVLMGERKQGWTFINKLITVVWFLAIDLLVAKVAGVL
jgi:flagellar biosynthesis protein FliP